MAEGKRRRHSVTYPLDNGNQKEYNNNIGGDNPPIKAKNMSNKNWYKGQKGAPEYGKQYALTGGADTPSIMRGDSWKKSEVKNDLLPSQEQIKRHFQIEDVTPAGYGPDSL